MKNKEPKEKKPGFLQRLKTKIDTMIENKNLTFLGKVFMLCIYGIFIDIHFIICIDFLKAVLNMMATYAGLTTVTINFTAAIVLSIMLAVCMLICLVVLLLAECVQISEENESILEKEVEKE